MTQTLTTIGHCTAFNNEQSPYGIVSYKRLRNDNVKQFKRENYWPYLYKKNCPDEACFAGEICRPWQIKLQTMFSVVANLEYYFDVTFICII